MTEKYIAIIEAERKARETEVRSDPVNWLSLVGRIPLNQGENRINGEVQVPGVFTVTEKEVTYQPGSDAQVTRGDEPFMGGRVKTDLDGVQDTLTCGPLVMAIIFRNGIFFLRLWDKKSPAVRNFAGFHYFPVREEYVIEAEFETFETPRVLETLDAIGGTHQTAFTGAAHFTWQGTACHLIAEDIGEEGLLFNFTDATRADLTYPGGRHLVSAKPVNNRVTLDFNRAENWPCAYTAFATCPLPSFENRLPVRIEAGEKRYHD